MDRIRSIVVGVDFTPCSASALRQALRIANWNRAKLTAVHVVDTQIAEELEAVLSATVSNVRAGLLAEVQQEWQRFKTSIAGAQDLMLHVDVDAPIAALEKRVRTHASDLLVMGTHGTSSPEHGTGTVATAVVRHAPTKVLLVRDPHTGPFRNVVACVDFSDTSRKALSQAARVAVQDEAFLHVIHVFEAPWRRLRGAAASAPIEKAWREALPVRLRDFAKPLASEMKYLKPEFVVIDRPGYGQAIAEYVRNLAAPLVVLGTRGRTNLRDLAIGSTAERVVRDAPCSILAVKPD